MGSRILQMRGKTLNLRGGFPPPHGSGVHVRSNGPTANARVKNISHDRMPQHGIKNDVIRTLLYYEIFDHPLRVSELYYLLPHNSLTRRDLQRSLESLQAEGTIAMGNGFVYLTKSGAPLGEIRLARERLAARRLRIARLMAHVIKRFPFVRAIFISGDLSKGVATPGSDIDYVIVTRPGRLWICRSLLILFKKIVLLNSRRYFCLNYFIDEDNLTLRERTYYTATEIAHLKPLFNYKLYLRYINSNGWITSYFPNYRNGGMATIRPAGRRSLLQKLFEMPFAGRWADRLDIYLMGMMRKVWRLRYPEIDPSTRDQIFLCSINESRAYIGNFSDRILGLYAAKLAENDLVMEVPAA